MKERKTIAVRRKGRYVEIDAAVYRYNLKKRRERAKAKKVAASVKSN